ncbi:MAG: 4-phosphoerythronate dehydrogenase [bacterium]
MKIICATNMPFAEEAFSTLGETRVLEGRSIGPDDVRDTGLLALRSTTKVDRRLLAGSQVRFVGTATIGTDHLDIPYLEEHGIHWCSAAGCNANSVGEYVVAALLTIGQRYGWHLAGRTLGVIGVGNVGRRVAAKAAALGLRVLLNDPPRARAEAGQSAAPDFVPLARLLAESDIVTLHVPLTRDGLDATWHLADGRFFASLKPGALLLNAARGPCIDSDALLRALDLGTLAHAALDTWEGEPAYRPDVMARMELATPHIAGHSFEGKAMGTVMVYQQACRFLGVPERWQIAGCWPTPAVPEVAIDAAGRDDEAVLHDVVRRVYAIEDDDRRFRATASGSPDERRKDFDRLRRDYPDRREFRFTKVRVANGSTALLAKLRELEFSVAAAKQDGKCPNSSVHM